METNLHGKTGFMIRALPPYLFIERHTFIPFLKIFLQDAFRVLAGVVTVQRVFHDRIDKKGHIIEPDFTVQGTDERLERSTGDTFTIRVLLPDGSRDQARKSASDAGASGASSARLETTPLKISSSLLRSAPHRAG
jgi:hypothetical protein